MGKYCGYCAEKAATLFKYIGFCVAKNASEGEEGVVVVGTAVKSWLIDNLLCVFVCELFFSLATNEKNAEAG